MSTDIRFEIEQKRSLQEYRHLQREKNHLLQKQEERGLSEWEHQRLLELPLEIKEVEATLGAITTAAIRAPQPETQAQKRPSGVTVMLSFMPEDKAKLSKTYVLR